MPVSQTMTFSATPPVTGQSPDTFNANAIAVWNELKNTTVPNLNTAFGQMNTLEENVNAKEASAVSAASTATTKAQLATDYAEKTGSTVETGTFSAKEFAIGDLTASGGSAKAWATDSASPDGTTSKSAKTHAEEAAVSATNALNSELAAAAILDGFDDRYLGSKASDPTIDNDGNPLQSGALYYNTTNDTMKVYDLELTTWIDISFTPTDHSGLSGRSDVGAHPISSITDLQTTLDVKLEASDIAKINGQDLTLGGNVNIGGGYYQEFLTSGTWIKPSGCTVVYVEIMSAGGGGEYGDAKTGAGGGGGGIIRRLIPASLAGASETIIVGAGGSGGTSGSIPGGTGGDSSFGSIAKSFGAMGGGRYSASFGGAGGNCGTIVATTYGSNSKSCSDEESYLFTSAPANTITSLYAPSSYQYINNSVCIAKFGGGFGGYCSAAASHTCGGHSLYGASGGGSGTSTTGQKSGYILNQDGTVSFTAAATNATVPRCGGGGGGIGVVGGNGLLGGGGGGGGSGANGGTGGNGYVKVWAW